jgi:tetratricopeptide (TPR) repeat protein
VPADARAEYCKKFWRNFRAKNAGSDKRWNIELSDDDLPQPACIDSAYRAVFETACVDGLGTPETRTQYLRAVTMDNRSVARVNGTHFFLASLLSLQGRGNDLGVGKERLYRGSRPFARTIFTTNFDPILQTSLQLFQRLYYMTDRPEFLPADALYTDGNPSIHLFYAHGSVHRPFLANTDGDIGLLRQRNAELLAGYLSSHGVIVLGYSGWDDCLLEALKKTRSFSNNLYWLVRGGEGSISPRVAEFLQEHPNAYWVPIEDGGGFMAELHRRLCPGAPNTELLHDPIRLLRSQLAAVSLEGIASSGAERDREHSDRGGGGEIEETSLALPASGPRDVETIALKVIERLKDAERLFEDVCDTGGGWQAIERQADLSYANNDWDSALQWYQRLLDQTPDLPTDSRALATFRRATCWAKKGDIDKAIDDYLAVIDITPAAADLIASTRINLGVSWAERGDLDKAISQFTAVADMTDAPTDLVAHARVDRGLMWRSRDDDKAIADYTAVIDMTGVPVDLAAKARFNRSVRCSRQGHIDKAMVDLDAVIDMAGAPVDLVASARFNRGVHREQQCDVHGAIGEYTAVIETAGAPADIVARARTNRGTAWRQDGKLDIAIDDYTAAIEMAGTPRDVVALARIARGSSLAKKGDVNKAIDDYTAVIDMGGVPPKLVAEALINRAVSWPRKEGLDKAIDDYTAVIEMVGAPVALAARARFDRGVAWREKGAVDKEMIDYTAVIEMTDAPIDLVGKARINRGIRLGENGDTDEAIADFRAIIEMPNTPADLLARAQYNLALAWSRKGDLPKAIDYFTAVINLPGAPEDLAAKAREVLSKSRDLP